MLLFSTADSLAFHMLTHIFVMSFFAPTLMFCLRQHVKYQNRLFSLGGLWGAAGLQIVLLFWWHSPQGMNFAMHSVVAGTAMHLSLFLFSCWFWSLILTGKPQWLWHKVFALLVTGKLFCLLALLLTFAPRVLYESHAADLNFALQDQQLAGSIMIAICPITYIAAAVILISRWLLALQKAPS